MLAENKGSDPAYPGALTLVWCNSLKLFASSFPGPLLVALSWPLSSGFPPGPLFNFYQHSDFQKKNVFYWDFNWRVQFHMDMYGCFLRKSVVRNIFCALQGSSGQFAGLRGMKII